jgi:hypothetical protein
MFWGYGELRRSSMVTSLVTGKKLLTSYQLSAVSYQFANGLREDFWLGLG